MNVLDLGFKNYKETWDLQKKIVSKIQNGGFDNTLIFVEHNDVFTFGKRGKTDTLNVKEEILKKLGFELYTIERGGDVTYHGPGQLVVYPIYDIKSHLVGVKKFVMNIETVIIRMLKDFGINADSDEKNIGVWIADKKIASIGVAFDMHISFHGAAINVNTDLNKFNYIIPCGLEDKGVTSILKQTGKNIPLDSVKKGVIDNWTNVFNEKNIRYIRESDICKENLPG
jgi:lipoyl(octanoyl) transferase